MNCSELKLKTNKNKEIKEEKEREINFEKYLELNNIKNEENMKWFYEEEYKRK